MQDFKITETVYSLDMKIIELEKELSNLKKQKEKIQKECDHSIIAHFHSNSIEDICIFCECRNFSKKELDSLTLLDVQDFKKELREGERLYAIRIFYQQFLLNHSDLPKDVFLPLFLDAFQSYMESDRTLKAIGK